MRVLLATLVILLIALPVFADTTMVVEDLGNLHEDVKSGWGKLINSGN